MRKNVKLKWVALASLLNNTGAAFIWPLTTMYVNKYLGQTLTTAGIVMLLISVAMMVGNYMGGWLFDHWNSYRTALLGAIFSTLPIILLIFIHRWPWYAMLMIINSFGDGINMTIVNSYGTAVTDHPTRFVFNYVYMAFNVGVVLGTLLVGALLPISVVLVFSVAAFFYVGLTLMVLFTFNIEVQSIEQRQAEVYLKIKRHTKFITLVVLILINVMTIHISYSLWESVMAVHMTNMGIPFFAYSLLWTLNGIIIIIGQPLVNKLSPHMRLSTQIVVGILIFASSFFFLIFAKNLPEFVIDFVILTIGETLSFAGLPAWITQLTGAENAGHYQGLYNIVISVGRAIGPLYGGYVIEHGNYQELFLSVYGLMMITLLFVGIKLFHIHHQQAR
ncbi:MDR family MFS transporter [Limosilactobacillus fastidiosus]|uniref:MFS transporter n=1 Tax=Limosilactobacillus fastidiosus TaxID=2759855 RepID=A0A7W3TY96_9LACO|nr:MFS transporter [Limosilactobacillus fastidiosus]MBB1062580.1 MFS transporter [Limosilactobacillus fastidiosus]MBB1085467.1 MFS transporter [Limosilactobacillus fastidiosus]MCD7083655.1 MFS transporter [Limosilactobacillus fastidiosus]MCD7085921.1 MFS transporter [Limosilactobacillus fastidiosus]MCD7114435.1 MFS transporter [Limosilactobacillus fastidiosus]